VVVRLAEIDAPGDISHLADAPARISRHSVSSDELRCALSLPVADSTGMAAPSRTSPATAPTPTLSGCALAWVFDRYVSDHTLYRLHDDARIARRGLWVDAQPVAPWRRRKSAK